MPWFRYLQRSIEAARGELVDFALGVFSYEDYEDRVELV